MSFPWNGFFVIIVSLSNEHEMAHLMFIFRWCMEQRVTEKYIQVATSIRHAFFSLLFPYNLMVFPFAWNLLPTKMMDRWIVYIRINTYFYTFKHKWWYAGRCTSLFFAFAPIFVQKCETLWCQVSRLIVQTWLIHTIATITLNSSNLLWAISVYTAQMICNRYFSATDDADCKLWSYILYENIKEAFWLLISW